MIELALSDGLTARLEAGAKAAADFSVPMAAIADVMRTDAVSNFDSSSAPDGKPWQPSERAREDGGLTLTDTGHLRQSITAANDATGAIIGTNMVYAAIHQFGGTIRGAQRGQSQNVPKPRIFPARPFLGFGPGLTADIEKILSAHLDQALNA